MKLEVKDLRKSFEETEVLHGISFSVQSGKALGLLGRNGAGKTTTIKSIVGIHDFEEGDILINSKSIKEHPTECKKDIAYIPDNPDLYEALTGIDYLNFIADVFRIDKSEREEKIKYYSEEFEINKSLGDLISSYSHGMKQKLAIISALIHSPKILILDEPFVGLDPKAAFTLKEIMRDFCNKGGCIFFSTHVLDVAEKICDKIAIINGGKLVACGETEKVKGYKSLENIFMEMIDHE